MLKVKKAISTTFCAGLVALLISAAVASSVLPASAAMPDKPQVTEAPVYVGADDPRWRPCEGLPGCRFIPLRGDATGEASEAIFRLERSVRFPKHWHTSPEHFVTIRGTLVINLENGDRFSLGPQSFLYNPGGMVHWGHCTDAEACVYYVYDDKPYDIHLVPEDATPPPR